MIPNTPPAYLRFLFFAYSFAFGVGTTLAGDWYYPIKGVGLLDILFVSHFLFLVLTNDKFYAARTLPRNTLVLLSLTFALLVWLLLSAWVNAFGYGLQISKVLAILRLLYFIVIVIFIAKHVLLFDYTHLLIGYATGVAVVFYQDFSTLSAENAVLFGFPVLSNPNVVGVSLGLAVYLCSLGVMAGKERLFLPLAILLAALTLTTFSKGAWLITVLALSANLTALNFRLGAARRTVRLPRFGTYAIFFFACIALALYWYGDQIVSLVEFKLETTEENGSFELRTNLLLAGVRATLDHPLLGMGFGNYYKVQSLYPEFMLPTLGPEDNAHNLFAQVAATGGIPALALLLAILGVTLWRLRDALHRKIYGPPRLKWLYLLVSVLIFGLFASVQLQLLAQPTFWFFSGIIMGLTARPYEGRAVVPSTCLAGGDAAAPSG